MRPRLDALYKYYVYFTRHFLGAESDVKPVSVELTAYGAGKGQAKHEC